MPAPAPRLTKDGRCSDCSVQAMLAGGGELKVCPQCHALLWHVDWSRARPADGAVIATLQAEKMLEA
jgi:hypothetical protein